jgi:hypothetical protein
VTSARFDLEKRKKMKRKRGGNNYKRQLAASRGALPETREKARKGEAGRGRGRRLVALDGAEDEVLVVLGNGEDTHLQVEGE